MTMKHQRRQSLPFISTSLFFLAASSSNNNIAASSSSSASSVTTFKLASKVSASVMADSSLPTMAVDNSPYQSGHGRNLQQDDNQGGTAIEKRQADNQIIRSEEDETKVESGEDLQYYNTDPYVTTETPDADSIAINNDGMVKDAVDALKELGVVLTENNDHNNEAWNDVVPNKDEIMPRIQPADNKHNADEGEVKDVDHVDENHHLGDQQQPQLSRQDGNEGTSIVSKPQQVILNNQQQQPNDDNNDNSNEQGSVTEINPQPLLAAPSKDEAHDDNQSNLEGSQQIITNTSKEQLLKRESISSAANNKVQGGQRGTNIDSQQPPALVPPLQKQKQQQQQQQQQQGVKALTRREKMQQELREARRGPQKMNPISTPEELHVPIIETVKEEREEVESKQQQQQEQQEQQERDVVQSGLRGGDNHNPRGVVTPQQQNEDVTPPIQEKPRSPEQQLNEEKRPIPLHHQAVLEKAREVTNEQSPPVEEIISDLAVLNNVESKPLPPSKQQQQQQQQQSVQQQQQQIPKPLSNTTSSSIQTMDNLPDAVKNTMMEMEKKDLEKGKEQGYHYKELREQNKREADLRRQKLAVGGGSGFVRPPPQAFRIDDPDAAQKFAEYIEKQKKGIVRREKIRHPIQTIVGGGGDGSSNNRGSVRTKDSSPMKNYKAQINHKKSNQKMPDLRPEAQPKKRVGQTILRKIPIVKRVVKRTHGFETLNDAALSFTRGLQMGVFRNNNHALDKKRKAALLDWLDLLSISLPPELGLHELIDTLKINMDIIAQSPSNLKAIIDKHPIPDSQYSKSCTKGVDHQGFFCGFWKLLHVGSVGFAEQQGGLLLRELHPNIRVFSPKEASLVLREYMGLFFNCDTCSKRFIAQYDECKFQSCNRLTDKTVDAPAESWAEFPLWLWEVHNDVSRSKAERAADFHEKQNRKAEAKKWERYMGAVYPHLDHCVSCWTAEGTWDLAAVYNHLEKEYWTFGVVVDSKMEALLGYKEASADSVSYGLGAYLGLGLAILLTYIIKKYKIRASGRHKKDDGSMFPSRSGDGKIKYRDS